MSTPPHETQEEQIGVIPCSSTSPPERHDKVVCAIQSSSTTPQQAQGEVRDPLIETIPPPPPGKDIISTKEIGQYTL